MRGPPGLALSLVRTHDVVQRISSKLLLFILPKGWRVMKPCLGKNKVYHVGFKIVVVVYHVIIVAIGHGFLQKFCHI